MPRHVVLSGEFGTDHVDALCGELAPVTELTSPATVRIDLSELQDLSASGLAALISTLRDAHASGFCNPLAEYVPPRSPALRDCLTPGNLAALLGPTESCVDDKYEPGDFRGCEPFSSRDDFEHVIASMLAWLDSTSTPFDTRFAIQMIARDLAMNVLQHADIGGGVIALKLQPRDKSLELSVADRGIGIRRSLAKNSLFKELSDDSVAVSTALAPGRSSVPQADDRGTGLYVIKLMLAENGGRLVIRSGRAQVTTPSDQRYGTVLQSFHGTLATAVLPTDRDFDLRILIRSLERVGGLQSVAARQSA
jgi:ABC-type transporter Mla MlaB component